MARSKNIEGKQSGNPKQQENDSKDVEAKIYTINRVAKVVKGGRRFSFAAGVVASDGKGRVGYGLGKAKEVTEAKAKAEQAAKKNMIRVYLKEGRTLHHDVQASFGAGKVLIRSAKPGTGTIAGGPMRAIFELLGVHDVVTKSIGSSNAHNMVGATFAALKLLSSPRQIAEKRGKKVGEIIESRETKEG
jgi:small subunit ribosomal protein S5